MSMAAEGVVGASVVLGFRVASMYSRYNEEESDDIKGRHNVKFGRMSCL